jgi:hypothetical protein
MEVKMGEAVDVYRELYVFVPRLPGEGANVGF